MQLWPWAQRLFAMHSPPFIKEAAMGAFIRGRTEQKEEIGGGFWGAEGPKELNRQREGNLRWAMDVGATLMLNNCGSLPSWGGHYARVDFKKWQRKAPMILHVETSANQDAHLFIGEIKAVSELQNQVAEGVEIVLDSFGGSTSVLRFGIQGVELMRHDGKVLKKQGDEKYAKFWVKAEDNGDFLVGTGHNDNDDSTIFMRARFRMDSYKLWQIGEVFVGSLAEKREQWLVCHE
eukprot:TRINITY_DN22959_c1_g2_i1.p1 TRINITY_DN22959_c1_g2~~TRINITY_DN22959_c1_g2_i1.p1  ORF type:complete len:234 (+),score=42.42 TRINITY_DN22959_c1_g2_i1:151-852(+)